MSQQEPSPMGHYFLTYSSLNSSFVCPLIKILTLLTSFNSVTVLTIEFIKLSFSLLSSLL